MKTAARAVDPCFGERVRPLVQEARGRAQVLRLHEPDENQLARRRRACQRLGDREQRVERVRVDRGDDHRPSAASGGAASPAPAASSDGSWRRIARSSACSAGPGSMPRSSTSVVTRRLVRGESLGLPPRAVKGEHQLAAQPLPKRVLRDQRLRARLRARRRGRPRGRARCARSSAAEATAPRGVPSPPARTARTRDRQAPAPATDQVLRAALLHSSCCEQTARTARGRALPLDPDHVARRASDDPIRAERLPQLRNVVLNRIQRRLRRCAPHSLSTRRSVETTSFERVSSRASNARCRRTAKRDRAVGVDDLQGAKDPELHLSARSQWPLSPPAHLCTD